MNTLYLSIILLILIIIQSVTITFLVKFILKHFSLTISLHDLGYVLEETIEEEEDTRE